MKEICRRIEKEDRVAELKELEDIFTALEEDRRNLQNLLQEQKEDYEMELRALERERVQERVAWEREMREREEALLCTFISVVVCKDKVMKDLRIQMDRPVRQAFCVSGHQILPVALRRHF